MKQNKQELNSNDLVLSEKSRKIQEMFDKISPKYDFLNRLLSFRQDIRWRKSLIKKIPFVQNSNGVLYDVACGTGDVIYTAFKKRSDYKTFIGFDISAGMLNQAQIRNNTSQIKYVLASAESLPVAAESADCVTISFGLRNVDDRKKALIEFHRVLKKGGKLIVLEFFPAKSSFFQNLFHFYFKKILPKIGGFFSDKSAYTYLPQSVSSMPMPHEFKSLLLESGFSCVESKGWLSGSTMLFKCDKS